MGTKLLTRPGPGGVPGTITIRICYDIGFQDSGWVEIVAGKEAANF
jgi:hypothetical protein